MLDSVLDTGMTAVMRDESPVHPPPPWSCILQGRKDRSPKTDKKTQTERQVLSMLKKIKGTERERKREGGREKERERTGRRRRSQKRRNGETDRQTG